MKSFNNFISETSSGSKGSGYVPVWDDKDDRLKKDVSNRKQKQIRQQQIINRQYDTDGGYGDSNTGAGARDDTPKKKSTKPDTPKPLSKKSKKILTQQQKVAVDRSDVWNTKFSEIERDAKGKKGEEIRKTVEKQSKNIDKGNKALVDRINDKSGNRPPNVKKGELGKLYKTGTDEFGSRQGSTRTNSKINQELQAKRTARINPTTGKATQKGVENFAINKLTKGLSTKGPTGREQLDNAKKLASNPNSAAYKDIENKINTSDYAGKRAKLASADELKKIKSDIKTSKTIDAKVDTGRGSKAPTNIKAKTTKTSLNTSTRQGRITYLWKKIKPTSKSSSTTKPNITKPVGKDFYLGGKHQTPGGTNVTRNLTSPNLNPDQVLSRNMGASGMDSNVSGSQPITKSKTTSGKPFKQFSSQASNKVNSNVAKLKATPKNLAKRVTGPAFAAWNFYDNWKAAKGSPLRKTVKAAVTTGAYYGGFSGGAALGTAGGSFTGPGAFVTGTAGGILGGDLAQKTAGSLFNKVWKPPTKTKTSNNNSGVGGTNGKDKSKRVKPISGGIRLGQ